MRIRRSRSKISRRPPAGTISNNKTQPIHQPVKQGGAVEQKEESAIFDPRSIGARQARDGHWYVPDQSRLGKYLTPTPRMRRWRWPGLLRCSPDALINGYVEPGQQDTPIRGRPSRCLGNYSGAAPPIRPWPVSIDRHFTCSRLPKTVPRAEGPGTVPRSVKDLGAVRAWPLPPGRRHSWPGSWHA